MTIIEMPRQRDAQGHVEASTPNRRIAITFTPEMFGLIDGLARCHDTTFAAEARRLLVIGMGAVLTEIATQSAALIVDDG